LIKKVRERERTDHADEVSNSVTGKLCSNSVTRLMSKQLAAIAKDAPIEVKLPELIAPEKGPLARRIIVNWVHSLLKELGRKRWRPSAPADAQPAVRGLRRSSPAFRVPRVSGETPRKQPVAIWLNLEAGERESEGFGTGIGSMRFSSQAGKDLGVVRRER